MTTSTRPNNATPVRERVVTSYPPRRRFRPYIVYPPEVPGVENAIDIHCHSNYGQQDTLSLAKLASQSGMRGVLFKTIGKHGEPPMRSLREVVDNLARWSEEAGVKPISCWAGWGLARNNKPIDLQLLRTQLDDGVTAIWLPIANSANTLSKIGARERMWDKDADPNAHTGPLPWDEAVKRGFYMLDDRGKLKTEYAEAVRMVAGYGRALFFGHPTHEELWAVLDLLDALGHRLAVVDHPFSPFVDLTIDEMRQVAAKGVLLNFTYDELSPMMGIDPGKMYEAIRTVGVEYFTLSSDAGDPLFPNSVECMRMIAGYMMAYGCTKDEIEILVTRNPAKVVGLEAAIVSPRN